MREEREAVSECLEVREYAVSGLGAEFLKIDGDLKIGLGGGTDVRNRQDQSPEGPLCLDRREDVLGMNYSMRRRNIRLSDNGTLMPSLSHDHNHQISRFPRLIHRFPRNMQISSSEIT